MQNNILANQKTEFSGDAHMQGLMLLAFAHLSKHWTSFQAFCRDVYFLCGNYIGLLAEIVRFYLFVRGMSQGLYVTVNFTALLFCGSFLTQSWSYATGYCPLKFKITCGYYIEG